MQIGRPKFNGTVKEGRGAGLSAVIFVDSLFCMLTCWRESKMMALIAQLQERD